MKSIGYMVLCGYDKKKNEIIGKKWSVTGIVDETASKA
jgi:hypothetical protein